MNNILEIEGHKAVICFDPEIGMFRGEFLGLAGGADFYADNVSDLISEGKKSMKVFLQVCKEKGLSPFREYSGRFNVRLTPEVHEAAAVSASAQNKSLNEWVAQAIQDAVDLELRSTPRKEPAARAAKKSARAKK